MAGLFPGFGKDDGRVGLSSGLSQNRGRVDVVEKSLEMVRPGSTEKSSASTGSCWLCLRLPILKVTPSLPQSPALYSDVAR